MRTPATVIVASMFVFVSALACGLFGFIAFSFSDFMSASHNLMLATAIGFVSAIAFLWFGIAMLMGKNWARVTVLVLSIGWAAFWIVVAAAEQRGNSGLSFVIASALVVFATLSTFAQKSAREFFRR